MVDTSGILNQMLVLLILLIVGYVAGKTKIMDEVSNQKLSRILVNITQCAMILAAVMNMDRGLDGKSLLTLLGISGLTYGLLGVVAFVFPKLLRIRGSALGPFRFMAMFGNVGFMGFPVIASIFGPGAVFYAAIFNIPFNILVYSLGIYLVSGGEGGRKFQWKLLANPALICSLIAVLFFALKLRFPEPVVTATTMLGDMTVPAAMLLIGSTLSLEPVKTLFGDWRIYPLAAVKLLLAPFLVWLVFHNFVSNEVLLGVAVVIAAMPVATNSTMLCLEYGGDQTLASKGIFLSTIVSVITIPLMTGLLLT